MMSVHVQKNYCHFTESRVFYLLNLPVSYSQEDLEHHRKTDLSHNCLECSIRFRVLCDLSEHLRSWPHLEKLEQSGRLGRGFCLDLRNTSWAERMRREMEAEGEEEALKELGKIQEAMNEETAILDIEPRIELPQAADPSPEDSLPCSDDDGGGGGGGGGQLCVVCLSAPRGAVFIPCGHAVGCLPCGRRVERENNLCPICRGQLIGVFPFYNN